MKANMLPSMVMTWAMVASAGRYVAGASVCGDRSEALACLWIGSGHVLVGFNFVDSKK